MTPVQHNIYVNKTLITQRWNVEIQLFTSDHSPFGTLPLRITLYYESAKEDRGWYGYIALGTEAYQRTHEVIHWEQESDVCETFDGVVEWMQQTLQKMKREMSHVFDTLLFAPHVDK